MFLTELQNAAESFNIKFNDLQLAQFACYYKLVIDWNKKINLTAITDPKDFAIKHIIDSVSVWNNDKFSKVESVIDIGTGAGFPGIPLKVYKPEIKITVLDSLATRINFLKIAADEMKLEDIVLVHSRAEDSAHNSDFREKFDLAVSRAVAKLNILTEYDLPFVKIGGFFAALKGSNVSEELEESKRAIKTLGGFLEEYSKIKLPNGDERNLIYIKKIATSPNKFPRKAGTPEKKPLY